MLTQIKYFEMKQGVDIGYHISNIPHPQHLNSYRGYNKHFKLDKIVRIAKDLKANIIIKTGKNDKWFIKKCPKEFIQNEIEKQKWRDTSDYTMYIIEFI